MAKKIWYSTPLKIFWDDLYGTQKKMTPELSDEIIFTNLRYNLLKAPLLATESIESRELMVSGLELWKEDNQGDLLHIFFLEQQLRDFLENTPLSDLGGVSKYLNENGKHRKIIYFKIKSQANCVVYSFGLHIPYEKNGYAFSLSINEDSTVELYFSHGINHGRMSDKFYNELKNKSDNKSIVLSKMFRLAINTIAYMRCFPECVTEGVPRITVERNEKRSDRNIMFQISEKIMESESISHSRIPHFRKGYFKLLKSDFYTNKQGELVYVTPTMVKGTARTVATTSDIDKFGKKKT